MGVGNLPNPPTAGQPVASAWGNAVSVRVLQAYASKAALDAGWNDAPEGAEAVTTNDMRVYQRRGGLWAFPLHSPMGQVVSGGDATARQYNTTSGIWYTEGSRFGPWNLLVNRRFLVHWSARWENKGTQGPPMIVGGDVSVGNTGDDVAFEGGGFGQQTLVYGQTLNGLGAAWRGSVTGVFHTKAAAGQGPNDFRAVHLDHRLIASTGTWEASMRAFTIADMGPWA